GTGKALGINDDSLGFVLIGVTAVIGLAWAQWQSYQDDGDDFFDTYDSRRAAAA
uniref:Photosystem II reaction center protein W (psbW) n=1 Tax=Chrysotila roscoffensis TaxID=418908 RepID=UPI003CDF8695